MHEESLRTDDVSQRMEAMVRELRRLRILVLSLAACGIAAVTMGMRPDAEIVEANEFVLRDRNGKPGGKFGWALSKDRSGTKEAYPSLEIYGKDRSNSVHLGVLPNGSAFVTLYYHNPATGIGFPAAKLWVSDSGVGIVETRDAGGNVVHSSPRVGDD